MRPTNYIAIACCTFPGFIAVFRLLVSFQREPLTVRLLATLLK